MLCILRLLLSSSFSILNPPPLSFFPFIYYIKSQSFNILVLFHHYRLYPLSSSSFIILIIYHLHPLSSSSFVILTLHRPHPLSSLSFIFFILYYLHLSLSLSFIIYNPQIHPHFYLHCPHPYRPYHPYDPPHAHPPPHHQYQANVRWRESNLCVFWGARPPKNTTHTRQNLEAVTIPRKIPQCAENFPEISAKWRNKKSPWDLLTPTCFRCHLRF